jgi:hypothetical protein
MDAYFEKLKALVPGRTLAMYLALNTFALGAVGKAEDASVAVLLIAALCLGFNVLGGIFYEKMTFVPVLLSSAALLLFMASQRFVGPLAALGCDTQTVFIIVGIVSIVFVSIVPILHKGPLTKTA